MPKSQERCQEIREETRNLIIRKSILYFARNGFAGTKISDLSKHIGIAQGTIYIYFKSKEELYDEIEFSDDYVRLPDKYELREKNVMYDFAESIGGNLGDRLCSALRGRHPYRYFKDTADRLGLLQEYYDFRFAAYCRFAEAWCEENDVKYHHRRKKKKNL